MKYGLDFTIEPLKKRCYKPVRRVKPFYSKESVNDLAPKHFKNCEQIRQYWAERKRKQRAKKYSANKAVS